MIRHKSSFEITTGFMRKINILRKLAPTAKPFNGVCEVPSQHSPVGDHGSNSHRQQQYIGCNDDDKSYRRRINILVPQEFVIVNLTLGNGMAKGHQQHESPTLVNKNVRKHCDSCVYFKTRSTIQTIIHTYSKH